MPRVSKKISATVSESEEMEIENSDLPWLELERAIGSEINHELRSEILERTRLGLLLMQSEASGLSAKLVVEQIVRVRKSFQEFSALEEILGRGASDWPPAGSAKNDPWTIEHAVSLVDDELGASGQGESFRSLVASISVAREKIDRACENALAKVNSSEIQRATIAWRSWIHDLAGVLEEHGHMVSARKDSDALEETSPFVKLVKILQDSLPGELGYQFHSWAGLSQQISRALSRRDKMGLRRNNL